jgi:hypothetical protein
MSSTLQFVDDSHFTTGACFKSGGVRISVYRVYFFSNRSELKGSARERITEMLNGANDVLCTGPNAAFRIRNGRFSLEGNSDGGECAFGNDVAIDVAYEGEDKVEVDKFLHYMLTDEPEEQDEY